MIQSRIQRQIPERLSHYTKIEHLYSILSNKEGKGICLRAYSNKHKNDDQEIKMGEYMLKRVIKALPMGDSILKRFSGYDDSASISFMEGEVNEHILEYGHYRLEFDLRGIGVGLLAGGLIDCEYVSESELKEYADEYCEMITSTFNSIPILQKTFGKFSVPPVNTLADFFMMENDIMTKVLGLKEQQWHEENEWRKVFELKTDNTEIFYHEGKPYVEYFLDKTKLTGITVFCSSSTYDKAQKDADAISRYISERDFDTKVRVEVFEMYQGASR